MDPLASMTASEVKFCPSIFGSRFHWTGESSTYLGSDKLQTRELPPSLLLDESVDLGIGILQRGIEVLVLFHRVSLFHFHDLLLTRLGGPTKSVGTGTEDDILID
jgi:hypothetical protein